MEVVILKRTMVFIDGNNFEKAVENLFGSKRRVDYKKLADLVSDKTDSTLVRFYYYTAQGDHGSEIYQKTQNFIDVLNKKVDQCIAQAGYLAFRGEDKDGNPIYVEKGTDIRIATDMLSLAYNNAYDIGILLSADTDYKPVINKIKHRGKIIVGCAVDGQNFGILKAECDKHIILSREDIEEVERE